MHISWQWEVGGPSGDYLPSRNLAPRAAYSQGPLRVLAYQKTNQPRELLIVLLGELSDRTKEEVV